MVGTEPVPQHCNTVLALLCNTTDPSLQFNAINGILMFAYVSGFGNKSSALLVN